MQRNWAKRLLKIALVGIVTPTLIAALVYAKWITVDGRLATVTANEVYQSAAYAPDDLVATCKAYDIKTVIDLRDTHLEDVAAAASAAQANDIHHVHLATESHPTVASTRAFLDAMATAERPVLVHCEHGEGRSVMLCAIWRIENEGWSNQRAFDGTARLPDCLRWLTGWFPSLRRLGEEDTKGKFIRNYRPGTSQPTKTPANASAKRRNS